MKLDFKLSIPNPFRKQKAELSSGPKPEPGKALPWKPKSVFKAQKDIEDWKISEMAALNEEQPLNYLLQLLLEEIRGDAHLHSQLANRMEQSFSSSFGLYDSAGNLDEEQTKKLKKRPAYRAYNKAILEMEWLGYSLTESALIKDPLGDWDLLVTDLPRTNAVPKQGRWYPDYTDISSWINYRELREYGTYILEFNSGGLGLVNKAVSHVMFKKFAQSCWSELCEIQGIPPRVLKTNTKNRDMLERADAQMRQTGSAPWFIIDESETFEWGQASPTKGEVFQNLIQLCKDEISLLVCGAVIGQDTVNGNRSKDQSAQEMLWLLVKSDMEVIEEKWNTTILPAFKKLGLIKGDLTFKFDEAEDIAQLWKFTEGIMQYKEVDNEWLTETFGVKVTGNRALSTEPPKKPGEKLSLNGFFD